MSDGINKCGSCIARTFLTIVNWCLVWLCSLFLLQWTSYLNWSQRWERTCEAFKDPNTNIIFEGKPGYNISCLHECVSCCYKWQFANHSLWWQRGWEIFVETSYLKISYYILFKTRKKEKNIKRQLYWWKEHKVTLKRK